MFGTNEPTLSSLDPQLQIWLSSITDQVDPNRLFSDVTALPKPRNRLHHSRAMEQAEQMVMSGFREAGWNVEYQPIELSNIFRDDYLEFAKGSNLSRNLNGGNIIAAKPGVASAEAVIVGAHLDTISDSPGADDNTASVAALLELARVLNPYRFERTIILTTFDMEELGHIGSAMFLRDFAKSKTIVGAIIFETMAYISTTPYTQRVPPGLSFLYPRQVEKIKSRSYRGDWTVVVYRSTSSDIAQAFAEGLAYSAGTHVPILMRDPTDLPILGKGLKRWLPASRLFARSDHSCFWEANVPAIMISDTADLRNPHYHQSTDTPETLDYNHLGAIVSATAAALARIARLKDCSL